MKALQLAVAFQALVPPPVRAPAAALLALLWAQLSLASTPQAASPQYEQQLLEWGLLVHGRPQVAAPEGLPVDEILIAAEDVIARSDPWPQVLNLIHVRTREEVIRREVLLQVGEPYRAAKAQETERNLRRLAIIATAKVVAVEGRAPGTVAVLVITKDLWSIRFNSEFNVVGTLLQRLRLRPSENNFLGRGQQLHLDFNLRLDTVSFGQGFADRRLLGTWLTFVEAAALTFNRRSGLLEGGYGEARLFLPLYSLEREWGFEVATFWNVNTTRIYAGPSVVELEMPGSAEPIPWIYETRDVTGSAVYTRAFGQQFKLHTSAGLVGYHRRYTPPASSGLSEEQRAWFLAHRVPRSEDALFAIGILRFFEPRFEVLRNVDTFALSEDFQLGPWLRAEVRLAPGLWGAQYAELGLAARYRWHGQGALLTLSAAAATRYMPSAVGPELDPPWVNRRFAAEVRLNSPPVWIGRFAGRALVDLRAMDLNRRTTFLGGGNGLRGVAAESLRGTSQVLFNVEYRTRPLVIRTLHVGGVLFWDGGSAFTQAPRLSQTVGVGLRMLFPQFDVEPLRIDFGYVIAGDRPSWLNSVSASFGQVTGYRPPFLDHPL